MNTTTGIAILLALFAVFIIVEIKPVACFLVFCWNTGTLQQIAKTIWYVFLAILVCLFGVIYGFFRYFLNESVRMNADTELEILVGKLTPKKAVKVKKATPLNHARIVAHVKPVKNVKKQLTYWQVRRSLMIGRMIARIKF